MTALLAASLSACGGGRQEASESSLADPAAASATGEGAVDQRAAAPACSSPQPAPPILPGTRDEHRSLDYWLAALGDQFDLDEVLLSPAEVATLNAAVSQPREGYFPQIDLTAPVDTDELKRKLAERSAWLAKKFASGDYVTRDGQAIASDALPTVPEPSFSPRLQVALGEVPFYCGATTDGFYAPGPDVGSGAEPAAVRLAIDRNRCSTAHAQELIQVLAPWPNQLLLARTRYTWGFISADAPLSPPLSREHAKRFAHGPFVSLDDADAQALSQVAYPVPAGRLLPKVGRRGKALLVATAGGVERVSAQASALRPAPRPLTRRAVLTEAFRYLDTPYGFGGRDGGRDCSRLLLDIFESFGLHLPRHSAWQSRAGSYSVELDGVDEGERLRLLDAAAARGVVIMHLPGHIMLYLGRDGDGRPMALHAFAEYMDICPQDGGEVLYEVDRVQVSDLELGRGTSKRAFLARIDRLTVFGRPPDEVLASVATRRPAAPVSRPSRRDCRRAGDERVSFSPARPDRTRPLRVIATAAADPGPAGLTLIDPRGEAHTPALVRLGGPPYGYTVTIDEPKPGRWLALFGDGDNVYGCERIYVSRRPREIATAAAGPTSTPTPGADAVSDSLSDPELDGAGGDLDNTGDPGGPASVWDEKQRWSPATEDLYAVFVERLFDYSIDEDLTWPSLDALTRDASRNLLYDHLGQGEDEHLVLRPDCADLPYTLRAYFAWKLGLPFGFRKCDRARPGDPPRCDPGADNLLARAELNVKSLSERQVESENRRRRRGDDVELSPDVVAFARFVDRELRRTVHSSSGRTHPDDDDSDFYPVPLTRRALRPGTLFTDPYGHLLVIADWIPQQGSSYGVLVGADAQPDGTVGRRRFWRGSFLFDPDVDSGGAGFKAFRPWERDPDSDGLVGVENRDLRSRRLAAPYSREQYEGSVDDFYDRMNALINPRPLNPVAVLETLVDALDETVSRRVTSVQNGEAFMQDRQRGGARGPEPIEMPEGADIFLTTGPWENYSTPARDLRLLISIDTVVKFPDAVARRPTQFGIPDSAGREQVARRVAALRQTLAKALAAREFSYIRSDGSEQRLTLAALVERQRRLEMAYNPNDCVEIRWAAAPGSDEMSTCQRHAPAAQRARMESYRSWFEHRKRPAN